MKNKINTLQQAEALIKPLAQDHVPQGSEVQAVMDQWLHAIATDSQFYSNPSKEKAEKLKKTVLSFLKKNGLYTTRRKFFNGVFGDLKLKPSFNTKFRFIDLFAGIGGVRLGFQQNGGACVFSSEFDKHAQQTYKMNHGEVPFGDITKIPPGEIPDHDILLAGFPCQAFSIAGYQQGFKDEKGRGNLFFNIYEIIKEKKPKAFLLENVKNLKSHDKGNTYKTIVKYLNELGYSVKSEVLNSMDYGNVPQTRERIYIVGFKDESNWQPGDKSKTDFFTWPDKIKRTVYIRNVLEKEVDNTFYYERFACHELLKKEMKNHDTVYQWRRHYVRENKSKVCPTLTANMGTGGHNVPLILDSKNRIRKLTPKECSRIQGFPDDFKVPQLAHSHMYKQFGNSVTVPVIERIATELSRMLIKNKSKMSAKEDKPC